MAMIAFFLEFLPTSIIIKQPNCITISTRQFIRCNMAIIDLPGIGTKFCNDPIAINIHENHASLRSYRGQRIAIDTKIVLRQNIWVLGVIFIYSKIRFILTAVTIHA